MSSWSVHEGKCGGKAFPLKGFTGCGKTLAERESFLSGFYETAVEFKGFLMFFYS